MRSTIPDTMIPIIRFVRTKEEKDLLREQITQLENELFKTDSRGFEKLLKKISETLIADAIQKAISLPLLKDNPEEIRKFFQELCIVIDTLPILKIDLAFKPSEAMIERLHEWIEKNIGIGVVADIGYDASIFGGSRIIFEGKYREVTLVQMITDALTREKANVFKLIK